MVQVQPILDRALDGKRLTRAECHDLLSSPDWTRIVAAGHARRNQLRDPATVSYTAYRVVNYTNFCDVDCTFCSFKDEIDSDRGYTLSLEQIAEKMVEKKKAETVTISKPLYDRSPVFTERELDLVRRKYVGKIWTVELYNPRYSHWFKKTWREVTGRSAPKKG